MPFAFTRQHMRLLQPAVRFRLPTHIRIAAFVSLCLCFPLPRWSGRHTPNAALPDRSQSSIYLFQAGKSREEVAASPEPPSSAQVRAHPTPCQRTPIVTSLPKVSNASWQRPSTRIRLT